MAKEFVTLLLLLGQLFLWSPTGDALTWPPWYKRVIDRLSQRDNFDAKDVFQNAFHRCGTAYYSPAEYRCVRGRLLWRAKPHRTASPTPVTYPGFDGYQLVWSDDFTGNQLNRSNWDTEITCWGGGNGEKECYVDHPETIFVEDGFLHVRATNIPGGYVLTADELARCTGNISNSCHWRQPTISGRLRTLKSPNGSWLYGLFAVRAKLPQGNYLWHAIWMLPTDNVYGSWASSGEIDFMEARGQVTNEIGQTLHYGGAWPNNAYTTHEVVQTNITKDFHVYSIEWDRDFIRFFVDDKVTWKVDLRRNWWSGRGPNPYTDIRQPWDQRFHFLLNVAVGGSYFNDYPPFNPDTDPSTWSSPEMIVDWVKVYQKPSSLSPLSVVRSSTLEDTK